ncbi:MAG: TonB-dependent receptor domain-containing protein [Bacteroidales bacterium]
MKKIVYYFALLLVLCNNLSIIAQENIANGRIKGRVYNLYSNKGIPFVNVVVWGTTIGTVSDSLGNYEITNIPPGYCRVTATTLGYEPKTSADILVTNSKVSQLDLGLEEMSIELGAVEIKGSPFEKRKESPVSIRTLDISEIEKTPGADRDISRVIQTLPGVASFPGYRNDLIVRGGGANENSYYLDDIEIPNINHFATQGASGGPTGIINTDFIREANFYSGAFPASKGDALSSILDLKLIEPNTDRFQNRLTLGFTEAAFSTNGPLSKRSGIIFSVRQSYLDLLFGLLELPFLPTYTDAQFKYKYRTKKNHVFSIIGLGALDKLRLNTGIKDPDPTQSYLLNSLPENDQETYTIGASYKIFDRNGFYTFVISRNYLNNRALKYYNNIEEEGLKTLDYKSDEGESKFRVERTTKGKVLDYNIGFGGQYSLYSNSTYAKIFQNDRAFIQNYSSKLDFFSYDFFGQISRGFFSELLTLSFGMRMDANNYSDKMNNPLEQFSPRFSANYFFTEKFGASLSYGKYFQLPPYTTLGFRNNSMQLVNRINGIKYIEADHFIAGLEFYPDNRSKISLEGFYKKYSDYPFSVEDSVAISSKGGDYGVFGAEEVLSKSDGRAYGVELMARDKDLYGFNILLSYAFVRSEFKNSHNNYIPAKWDNKHILNLTVLKSLKRNWEIGFRWRFVGGSPYTPYDLDKSSLVLAWNAKSEPYLNYSAFNTLRLPVFHQLDLRIDKEWFLKKWSVILFFDIQNVYNLKYKDQDLITNLNEDGNSIIINPEAPIDQQRYKLRRIENLSGTIVPSFGFIVEF